MSICAKSTYTNTKNVPNEDNPDIIEKYVTTNFWGNAECIGEKCGAYFDGKCHYNG